MLGTTGLNEIKGEIKGNSENMPNPSLNLVSFPFVSIGKE